VKDHDDDRRGDGPITQPEFWRQPRWHVENRPVVGVSWYEAVAYCAWLTEKSGRAYRLPDEYEWERAARHTDGRQYPWGNEWEEDIIKSRDARISRTITVGAVPRGAAFCGAQDMSGNVWEWTSSLFESGSPRYVVRGGSGLDQYLARVTVRQGLDPDEAYNFGFRVVSPVF
jgi:formylglycine-generating enzyme required for sulfatase activity